MNTNPHAIKVLCYGDSNVWGQKPDKTGRLSANLRWTGLLQEKLGNGFNIIEDGLGGRTTDLDYVKPGRNGREYFVPCLVGQSPIDVVMIMLGTNDLKMQYKRTAEDIANAIEGLVSDVKEYAITSKNKNPKIILVSPIRINDQAPRFAEFYTGYYDQNSMKESLRLAGAIEKIAYTNDCIFLNSADVAEPGEDGIHLSEDSHASLSKQFYDAIFNLNTGN